MEACCSVEKETDKATTKIATFRHTLAKNLTECDFLIGQLKKRARQSEEGTDCPMPLTDAERNDLKRIKELLEAVSANHKEAHGPISKIGKSIDKSFASPETPMAVHDVTGEKQKMLNEVIADHLLWKGSLDVAKCLINEANLPITHQKLQPFYQMSAVLEGLRNRDITLAQEFCNDHRSQLDDIRSTLDFQLHRLQFVQLINKKNIQDALNFSTKLSKFLPNHPTQIQGLMGAMMSCASPSPPTCYSRLLQEEPLWHQLIQTFSSDARSVLGCRVDSALSTCVSAGCAVLPGLINLNNVMSQRKVSNVWTSRDELPIETDANISRYHSLVACPILRQACSEEHNPPMRLFCGHVISRDALMKLTGGNFSAKFKCPYCPVEQTANDSQQIHF